MIGCVDNSTEERIPVEPNNGIGDGATPPQPLSFSENIEEAHHKTAFMMQEAVSFDIVLSFRGSQRLDAKISMTTNSNNVRVDKADGTSIVYNGEQTAVIPDNASTDGARFDLFTWQYFFAMPFKLTDRGTVWEEMGEQTLDSLSYNTSKLTFNTDIGDSPDDWYIIYQDPETSLLKAAAYIVTFNADKEKAEENPHAIVYSEYTAVEGISFAKKWTFHNWNKVDGLGEKLGKATVSNIEFFSPTENYFQIPEDSRLIEKE